MVVEIARRVQVGGWMDQIEAVKYPPYNQLLLHNLENDTILINGGPL